MTAYYNELDPVKAETIREAIKAGEIAPGDVDERSIKDVTANDVMGYRQCHWFAGGGFWSLALRSAGWPDNREVWTGSCPCPSFSAAGKGGGFDDPRHLWPDWFRLIRQCRPPVVFAEQVSAAIRYGWFDLVQSEMEAEAYAVGPLVLGAHSVGSPHIRQRLYFVADASRARFAELKWGRQQSAGLAQDVRIGVYHHAQRDGRETRRDDDRRHERKQPDPDCSAGECADTAEERRQCLPMQRSAGVLAEAHGADGQQSEPGDYDASPSLRSDADGGQSGNGDVQRGGQYGLFAADRGAGERPNAEVAERRRSSGEADYGRRPAEIGGPSSSGDGLHPICPRPQGHAGDEREWRGPGWLTPEQARSVAATGATRGFWADCDWWYGRDGKFRPIGPGLQPLAHGSKARVGRLRMYGDAICVPLAQAFIESYLEIKESNHGNNRHRRPDVGKR